MQIESKEKKTKFFLLSDVCYVFKFSNTLPNFQRNNNAHIYNYFPWTIHKKFRLKLYSYIYLYLLGEQVSPCGAWPGHPGVADGDDEEREEVGEAEERQVIPDHRYCNNWN